MSQVLFKILSEIFSIFSQFAVFQISRKYSWKFTEILINYHEIELNFTNNLSENF